MSTAAPRPPLDNDVTALSYEEARDQLVDVVSRLEAGAATLEDSLALWERGEALADRCQQWLDGARERLEAARDGASTDAANGPANGADEDSAYQDEASL
ncbi:exodeoxyribonuclease VII small subunit [Luteimicrobium sp. DT211]|uniref:exodeoxyribonuclease VII small subunit n=1 Tax=Luteimicrobium sp. DT211 TaxID=3393412 RepID=UPI003CF2F9B7